MKVDILVLCDYASTMDGKLVLVGAFDTIRAPQFPLPLGNMGLGLRMRRQQRDASAPKTKVQITLRAPNGATIINVDADAQRAPNAVAPMPSDPESESLALSFNAPGVTFPQAGKYVLEVRINGQVEATALIYAVQLSPAQVLGRANAP